MADSEGIAVWFKSRVNDPDGSSVVYEVKSRGKTVRYHVDKEPLPSIVEDAADRAPA